MSSLLWGIVYWTDVFFVTVFFLFMGYVAGAAFVHPGCLSRQADLERMAAKVTANEQPWKGSWDILVGNTGGYLDDAPLAQTTINVGGGLTENYIRLAMDCAKAYQCALRYNISGETAYGDKAVEIMNAWASTHTGWAGDSNCQLRSGLYGHQFACAAELMRDYSGWAPADFAAFKTYMIDIYFECEPHGNKWFLDTHNGTCDSHYWANWELAAMDSAMAIGILTDRQDIFDYALNYYHNGIGNGNISNLVHYIHPNGLGQWQEIGRDQGHTAMAPGQIGAFCEMAWNQGYDLYGEMQNACLSAMEHIAKYNLYNEVPYVTYINCEYWVNGAIGDGQGSFKPGWDLIYNHYVNRKGMAAPYTKAVAEKMRPEGGGFNYGTTSGGFDSLGFTTLTHSLDPIASGVTPSELRPYVKGSQITLSWRGSAYAKSYNVKRSTTSGGPYTTLATVGNKNTYYVDPGLTMGTTYYYVVSANNPGGESANSVQTAATPDGQLYGTVIGTDGSWDNRGADKYLVFDGSLRNFFDAPTSTAWAGLDLGGGVSAVITKIKYCPREPVPDRMLYGKFQGSNAADFSSGVTDLFTITSTPPTGVLTSQNISNGTSFRYVRYLSPTNGYGNVAEVQFLGNVTGLSAPATPGGVNASVINGYQVNLSWNSVSGATSYNVKRTTTSGGLYVIVRNVTGTNYSDIKLGGDTTYYYVISALNSAGESTNSTEVGATTQTASPILTAHYEMEGDMNDSSGNGYHGTVTGSPTYTTGPVDQAIDLDGTDDYVTLPAGVADTDNITIAAWVNWDGGDQWQRIFDFGNSTSQYLFLTPYSGDATMRFAIVNGGSEQVVETSTLTTGVWTHVAVTLAGDWATLYVDGLPVDTNDAVTVDPSDFNATINYIGDSQWNADPLFSGQIDDFRIYNYALSEAAVARLAQQQMNMADLSILAVWWLWLTKNCGTNSECLDADINGDGKMNLADFVVLARNWL